MLQWGRVLMNAETGADAALLSAQALGLQWGRVLMNAETIDGHSDSSDLLRLQWGRVLMNAETTKCRECPFGPTTASMGPRSHERGNPPYRGPPVTDRSCFNGAAFS